MQAPTTKLVQYDERGTWQAGTHTRGGSRPEGSRGRVSAVALVPSALTLGDIESWHCQKTRSLDAIAEMSVMDIVELD